MRDRRLISDAYYGTFLLDLAISHKWIQFIDTWHQNQKLNEICFWMINIYLWADGGSYQISLMNMVLIYIA